MKKYVKPELFYEHFELTQHIADCAWELNSGSSDTCSASADTQKIPGMPNLFIDSANGCILIPGDLDGGNYEEYCYHSSVQAANVFAS